jgi:C4-type Zn-finger protein
MGWACSGSLIFLIVEIDGDTHLLSMNNIATPETEIICPVCGQTMTYRHRVRSAFHETADVFGCTSCNFSTTYEVKAGMDG